MRHETAWERLPDLLVERAGGSELRRHVARCHACQRQLFLLQRVDRLLRSRPSVSSPKRRASWLRRMIGLAALGAVAAILLLALFLPRAATVRELTFYSAAGPGLRVQGSVSQGDAANAVLTIVASGLPHERANANYLVWASTASQTEPVIVGRFMADPSGECRARFNLPRSRPWRRFWVTPESSPARIVAAAVL